MTVYVDDYRVPAQVGRISARWSHLFVAPDGDLSELHALAARIGLRRSWFQDKEWPRAHYDVTDAKRAAAIAAGAVPISWKEAGRWRAAAIDARKATTAKSSEHAAVTVAPARRYPALTVHQPWAWALACGFKPVENRLWKIGYRGPLWLHAGKTWDTAGEASQLVNLAWIRWTGSTTSMNRFTGTRNVTLGPDNPFLHAGAVIAMLEVTGCHHSTECINERTRELCSPWAVHGQYHVQVAVTVALPTPVSCRGKEKLWPLPEDAEEAARAQLGAAQ